MLKQLALAFFLACGLVSVHAQTDTVTVATAQQATAAPPAAAVLTIAPGDYRGDVSANNGDYAFHIKIEKVDGNTFSGTSHFYKADAACRRPLPMTGSISPEGKVVLDATKDLPVEFCGRMFDLKTTSTGFEGTLKGTRGTFSVKLTRL